MYCFQSFRISHFLRAMAKSIRSFIGAKDFNESRRFYKILGFDEISIGDTMSYFSIGENVGFYLQNYFVKDWVNNSMLFLEVEHLELTHEKFKSLNLTDKFSKVRLSEIVVNDWGSEFFLHDPSGILWHVGTFNN